jgi:hypothetical protein
MEKVSTSVPSPTMLEVDHWTAKRDARTDQFWPIIRQELSEQFRHSRAGGTTVAGVWTSIASLMLLTLRDDSFQRRLGRPIGSQHPGERELMSLGV